MKKRLRKKLHKREFKEMGFYVRFRVPETLSDAELDAFLDQFLEKAIEAHGLGFGGSGHYDWQGFVALDGPGSVTNEQRETVDGWLSSQSQVLEHEVSELRDAWYDTKDWP